MVREPIFKSTALKDLRPTQITVGMQEVAAKRRHWKQKHGDKAGAFFGSHLIPVLLRQKDRRYVTDHHHLARALYDEGVREVASSVVLDLSHLDNDAFWVVLDTRDLLHPFDERGRRQGYDKIPKSISDLVDDPFRSLAGALRRTGGYAKDTTPFSEFLWADFLRRRVKRQSGESNFSRALEKALQLAKSREAGYLPGWCGPTPEE